MGKIALISSIVSTHTEINEQKVLITGFLKEFNKIGILTDLGGIIEFFTVSLVRHFMKENVIFSELLSSGKLDRQTTATVEESISEHDAFIDEFRQLGQMANALREEDKNEQLHDFLKKCQYLVWALSKHAQIEDIVIFPEVTDKLDNKCISKIESVFLKI